MKLCYVNIDARLIDILMFHVSCRVEVDWIIGLCAKPVNIFVAEHMKMRPYKVALHESSLLIPIFLSPLPYVETESQRAEISFPPREPTFRPTKYFPAK